jgi:hypothetical protein
MSKIHSGLKWSSIVKRINDKKNEEYLRISNDSIYKISNDEFGKKYYILIGSINVLDKELFIDNYA